MAFPIKRRSLASKGKFKLDKANASKIRAEGVATKRRARTLESEKTKRTVARSTAFASALSNKAKYDAMARSQSWNSIITGSNNNYDPNLGTSDNDTDSTSNPSRDGR